MRAHGIKLVGGETDDKADVAALTYPALYQQENPSRRYGKRMAARNT